MISLKIDVNKCDGCGKCQVACSLGHKIGSAAIEESHPGNHYCSHLLWISKDESGCNIEVCRHCEEPICRDACIAGAISVEPDGKAVVINAERCVGCRSCIMECPFNSIRLRNITEDETTGIADKIAVKCDGCKGWKRPLCVAYCPTGAIDYSSDISKAASMRRRSRTMSRGMYQVDRN